MQDYIPYIFGYFIFINLFSCFLTIWDKCAAIRHKRRVRESTLIWCSILGGSPTMLLTMCLIRHKTRHKKFMIGIPVILFLQAGIAFLLFRSIR